MKSNYYAREIHDLATQLESDLNQMDMYRYDPTTIRARNRIERLLFILTETRQNISDIHYRKLEEM